MIIHGVEYVALSDVEEILNVSRTKLTNLFLLYGIDVLMQFDAYYIRRIDMFWIIKRQRYPTGCLSKKSYVNDFREV